MKNKKSLKLVVGMIVMLSLLVMSVSTALAYKEDFTPFYYYVDASYGGYQNSVPLVIELDGDPSPGQTFNVGDTITISGDIHAYAEICTVAGNRASMNARLDVDGPSGIDDVIVSGQDIQSGSVCAVVDTIDTLTFSYNLSTPGTHTVSMNSHALVEALGFPWETSDNVSDSLTFEVIEPAVAVGSVSGGGQIHEAPDGLKRPYWNVISFGGWAEELDVGYAGEWEVNFHNVGVDAFDKTKFHTTNITVMNFYVGNSGTCNSALNFTAIGEWNQNPGYKMIFRAGDFGSPGFVDTVRVTIKNPSNIVVYDTHEAGEFSDESSCVGGARTGLDAGNITIVLP